jgi:hypothetical protein
MLPKKKKNVIKVKHRISVILHLYQDKKKKKKSLWDQNFSEFYILCVLLLNELEIFNLVRT